MYFAVVLRIRHTCTTCHVIVVLLNTKWILKPVIKLSFAFYTHSSPYVQYYAAS